MATQQVLGKVPVGVSNRHVHLSEEALARLFGPGYELTKIRYFRSPVSLLPKKRSRSSGPKRAIENVRILGPARSLTQVEISRSDGFVLGVHPPVRLSGELRGRPA